MKLVKNSGIFIFGEVFSKIIPFLLLPYLTRKLGAEGFGELANIQAYIALAIVAVSLSQEGAVARYFYFYGKRSIGLVVKCGYTYSSIITIFLLLLSLSTQNIIIFYVALTAFSQTILGVQLSIRQCQKKAIQFVSIQIINGLLTVLLTFFLLEFVSPTFESRVLAIIGANLLAFFIGFYLYRKQENFRVKLSKKNIRSGFLYIFAFGFPLVFHKLSFFLKGQLDRVFIYEKFSPEELGVYAVGFQLASVFSVLLMAINKACVPFLYEKLKSNDVDFSMIKSWMIMSFVVVPIPALIGYLVPESIYTLIAGAEFLGIKYYSVIFLFGLGLGVPYLLLVNYLFYFGKNKYIAICTFTSSTIYLVMLYFLLNFGIKYVPLALIISNVFSIFLLYYCCGLNRTNAKAKNNFV